VNLNVYRAEIKANVSLKYDHRFKYPKRKYWFHIQIQRMAIKTCLS
jgi:hypothetical protein